MKDFNTAIRSIIGTRCNTADWFDVADVIYIQYISGISILTNEDIYIYSNRIIDSADEDGFFYSSISKKSHNKYHSTAYALATIELASELVGKDLVPSAILHKLDDNIDFNHALPKNFTLIDRLHVWKASHTFGGLSSIFELLCKREIKKQNPVLNHYKEIIGKDGLWRFANFLPQFIFDLLYRARHDPKLALYGGAAHLYWHFDDIPSRVDIENAVEKMILIYEETAILEKVPYCLDYDVLFILRAFQRSSRLSHNLEAEVDKIFNKVGLAIYEFLINDDGLLWLHALPGLLAAMQVACESQNFNEFLKQKSIELTDPMEKTSWL